MEQRQLAFLRAFRPGYHEVELPQEHLERAGQLAEVERDCESGSGETGNAARGQRRPRSAYARRHRALPLCDPGKLQPNRHAGDADAWIRHHRHLERRGLTDRPSRSALSFR
jgi:hypothetical protein